MATITVTPTHPVTTSSLFPDNNTYVVDPGSTLTVAGGLGPRSVIDDFGGTVLLGTPPGDGPNHLDQGTVSLLGGGFLVFAGMQFLGPATVPPDGGGERIRVDDSSVIGIANAPAGLPTFNWVTNLDGFFPTDPVAGSFNLTFGTQHFGLDVGSVFPEPPPLSRPAWSVFQPFPGADIISPANTVPAGMFFVTNAG